MLISTINNSKLYIQFDRIVTIAIVSIHDEDTFSMTKTLHNTEFASFDLPKSANTINLTINTQSNTVNKVFNLNNKL